MTDAPEVDVVDVAFRLPGGRLPVDHAYALFREVSRVLPWFEGDDAARLHQVHTAASGSGWMRPGELPADELHLSRRTRLLLRVPRRRARDAMALSAHELDVGGYPLVPGAARILELAPADTLLARHVACDRGEDESRLVARLTRVLGHLGAGDSTLICGRAHRIATPDGIVHTRSVVVTNLDPDAAMTLLRCGVGAQGNLGCGVFVPYKRID